jgi:riboflavin synthase
MKKIGVVDTMFARINMGAIARDELEKQSGYNERFKIVSLTVPGFKDLAVACKRLIELDRIDIALALGMPGKEPIDERCADQASFGIMMAQLLTSTPILEVFVHMNEAATDSQLLNICEDRVRKHAVNAYWMIFSPDELASRAGKGIRQGSQDAGPIDQ